MAIICIINVITSHFWFNYSNWYGWFSVRMHGYMKRSAQFKPFGRAQYINSRKLPRIILERLPTEFLPHILFRSKWWSAHYIGCSLSHNVIHAYLCDVAYKPSLPPGNLIGSPSSRRNVIVGGGEPVAEHFRVTLLPSLTTISVLVG